jgi:phosphoketolase
LRKEKSPNDSSALDEVPASVREQNHHRKINTLKKKMAQLNSVKNKPKREALLQEANALLVDMADALVKKNKKNVRIEESDEEEANLAELPVNTHTPTASPNPKPKKKKTGQDDEFDRTLAHCTVQRFAGCSVPSNFTL